ncbi:MAG: iron-only hydrogenase system regulator [Spirochaetaceae bacterium]|jgi:putative iron-only hydrogenase system regulator|nr:iron-only hydrogenase system regulator [Spirochaetaceae bacterium]
MSRIAVVGAILENPQVSQKAFNETLGQFKGIVQGRMGIPFDNDNLAVISITLLGELDDINALTGKLGNLAEVTVKTAISGELTQGEHHGK